MDIKLKDFEGPLDLLLHLVQFMDIMEENIIILNYGVYIFLKENLTDLLVIILLKKYKDLNKYQNLENY